MDCACGTHRCQERVHSFGGKLEQEMPFGRTKGRWEPIPVAARSKAWVCGRSLAGIVGSIPAGGMDDSLL